MIKLIKIQKIFIIKNMITLIRQNFKIIKINLNKEFNLKEIKIL